MNYIGTARAAAVAAAAVLLALSLGGCGAINKANAAKTMEVPTPDFGALEDGDYRGYWDAGLVQAEVLVRVDRGVLTAIDILRHDCGKGGSAEAVVQSVLEAQSLEVDTVAGATVSSKTILKAVEQALTAPGPLPDQTR